MMTIDDMGGGGVDENDDVICEESKCTKFVNKMVCFGLFLCIIGVLCNNKPLKIQVILLFYDWNTFFRWFDKHYANNRDPGDDR